MSSHSICISLEPYSNTFSQLYNCAYAQYAHETLVSVAALTELFSVIEPLFSFQTFHSMLYSVLCFLILLRSFFASWKPWTQVQKVLCLQLFCALIFFFCFSYLDALLGAALRFAFCCFVWEHLKCNSQRNVQLKNIKIRAIGVRNMDKLGNLFVLCESFSLLYIFPTKLSQSVCQSSRQSISQSASVCE